MSGAGGRSTPTVEGRPMRVKAAILATLMLVSAACSAAAPAPQQSTEADSTLSGAPGGITLWPALSGPQYGNKLLSWPFTKSLAVMYVNNDVLKEIGKPIPKTWDEFEATALAATKKDSSGKVTRYGFAFNTDASYFNAQVYARGGTLMAADNKTVAWNGKEGLAVLQMYDRMNKNGSGYSPKG